MAIKDFPFEAYCRSIVRFLDALDYQDDNLTHEQREADLQYVHNQAAAWFEQHSLQTALRNVNPKHIAACTRTITNLVVCYLPRVSREVLVDVTIYFSIINIVDDDVVIGGTDPAPRMTSFWPDLLQGKDQQHPYWTLMNAHLPQLLAHYGPYCGFNIIRCTIDYFQGCWIEQHDFAGYRGSDCYPMFLRKLNSLGGVVGASMFPASDFDEQVVFKEITCVLAQIDNPAGLVNDLFSYYKEYDQAEINLVANWCEVDGISKEQALDRLTELTTHSCTRLLELFKDKDPAVFATVRAFMHGYVTWHFCDLRYRQHEIFASATNSPDATKFREYLAKAARFGWVDMSKWAATQQSPAVFTQLSNGHEVHEVKVAS
ncbi:hypothetical protein BAUCODRAFT_27945 [Baudoinia panamericana UAMH 10762]|uniref:Trichodiene synthase n=1 Tax=Baudoinia panamericana (strain UAMH 10762) TaxID=717646 RepID=M2MK16_BAUPA|nr:uncharacterized protein BAUCODRAFT_27945 [Baudoinia panamericana UAMH 10762]EMC91673.1 hypothetical protein BAUCODRAFT_27945 [Baudoinia panamericana UAMH 10762]